MAKRGATSDINHDNWNAPFEPEEPGVFSPASKEELQKRVIKTAKRRIKTSDNHDSSKKNIFASFGGFKPPQSLNSTNASESVATQPLFGSLGTPISSRNKTTPSTGVDSKSAFGFLGTMVSSSNVKPTSNGQATSDSETKTHQTYIANLKQLNKSVSDWIKQHVDSDPICILSPVFKEYDDYLKKIQEERDSSAASNTIRTGTVGNSGISTFNLATTNADSNKFTINFPTKLSDGAKPIKIEDKEEDSGSSNEDSGKSPLLQNKDTKPTPSIFGSFKRETSESSLFTKPDAASLMVNPFLSKPQTHVKPFSHSNGAAPTSFSVASSTNNTKESNEREGEEEESDEPPKVEFTPVQEEGSLFSTRCKVFVKKDATYAERGVGTLFIKQVSEGKHQLLVRAETVIGTVLVNTLLSAGVPTQRMGKNNVMLVCIPTPQEKPPPTTVLLRVKTAEEADRLLATIQKYKQ